MSPVFVPVPTSGKIVDPLFLNVPYVIVTWVVLLIAAEADAGAVGTPTALPAKFEVIPDILCQAVSANCPRCCC
jgi:urea transporter